MTGRSQKLQYAASFDSVVRRGVAGPAKTDGINPDSSLTCASNPIFARRFSWHPESTVRTDDRRSRQDELSELAGVQMVRKLGPMFMQEPVPTPRPGPVLGRINSEVLRRWREIEDESGRRERRGIGTDRPQGGAIRNGYEEAVAEGHTRSYLLRLRGREARLELIMRAAKEREKELEDLKECRRVSGFIQRGRLQSLLRRKLFHLGSPFWKKTFSTAANELQQLRDQRPVTALRERNFHHQASNNLVLSHEGVSETSAIDQFQSAVVTEAIIGSSEQSQSRNGGSDVDQIPVAQAHEFELEIHADTQNNSHEQCREQDRHEQECSADRKDDGQEQLRHQDRRGQEEYTANNRKYLEQVADGSGAPTADDEDVNWLLNLEDSLPQETQESTIEDDDNHLEPHEPFHQNESDMLLECQQDNNAISRSGQQEIFPSINASSSLNYSNVNMELRQLLFRRSVSNMSREFRDSLNQLVRSFIQTQERNLTHSNLQQNLQYPDLLDNNHDQQRYYVSLAPEFSIADTMQDPPTPPPPPAWHQDHHESLSQLNIHQPHIESEVVNDLRAEISKLQDGMIQIQRMLDACLDMQQELQRSVRQEVSAALNRYISGKDLETDMVEDGLKWKRTRKGTCCICCENAIDSLLYRCGHMCTCYQCGSELFRTEGKCPLCRAPLVEVIRAYSIM